MTNNNCCIFPICGSATRIGGIPKFLLPVTDKSTLLKLHLDRCIESNTNVIIITTPINSTFVYKYIQNNFDISKFTIILTETNNMTETVLKAKILNYNLYSVLMPDTFISYDKLYDLMYKKFNEYKCDVLLGIFKIRNEQRGKLGQVKYDDNYNLLDVIDKDKNCEYEWAWGTIFWNKNFFSYMDINTSHIGYALLPALNDNLDIKVCKIPGDYYDCGTISEYKNLLNIK